MTTHRELCIVFSFPFFSEFEIAANFWSAWSHMCMFHLRWLIAKWVRSKWFKPYSDRAAKRTHISTTSRHLNISEHIQKLREVLTGTVLVTEMRGTIWETQISSSNFQTADLSWKPGGFCGGFWPGNCINPARHWQSLRESRINTWTSTSPTRFSKNSPSGN